MRTPKRITPPGRTELLLRIDPAVGALTREAARVRSTRVWRVVDEALRLGIPLLEPLGEALPEYAYEGTVRRGRPVDRVCVIVTTDVATMIRGAAAARDAHLWWVAQEALALGLPLLPPPTQAAALDYDEELPQSA